ncbi:MAG: epimerase [Flavobacteriales bacterium]|nr:epimerase [Flavobacteriales bacterium]
MKVIITGSTGMVGKGVLLECMDDAQVKGILLINRNPLGIDHPKVKEVIHRDFSEFESIKDHLSGYDACFHCMGVSSAGMNEEKYTELTYGVTEALARTLYGLNPHMVMNYVSGTGTDSTEQSITMWKRVKGRTENMILKMGFKDAYMFRPGAIIPKRGIKSKTPLYNILYIITRPIFPLLERMQSVTSTTAMGKAMINSVNYPQELKHLEGKDINVLASKSEAI